MDFVTICGGRIFKDSTVVTTKSGKCIVKFPVICSRGKDKAPKFYNCAYWGDIALKMQPYLVQNKLIDAIGELNDDKDANGRVWTTLTLSKLGFTNSNKADREELPTMEEKVKTSSIDYPIDYMKQENARMKALGQDPKFDDKQIREAEAKQSKFEEDLDAIFNAPINDSDIPW